MKKYFKKYFILSIVPLFIPFGTWSFVHAAAPAAVQSPFHYEFRINGRVNESSNMGQSDSPYWWVNSGAQMILDGGVGKTIQGELPLNNYWQRLYSLTNPIDTDVGIHPQNIFRLLTRSQWQNAQEEIHFKINRYHQSQSPNRDGYNGVLLFQRYIDSQNLYYTGIRVDGTAVIKKKKNGVYFTLASQKIFTGTYHRLTNPNLLPLSHWMAIRSTVQNNPDGTLQINLFLDKNNSGSWILIASAVDDGHSFGGDSLTHPGYGGVRTDFMDTEFDDFFFRAL